MRTTSARVVLSLSASRSYDRGCLRGIAQFLHFHGPWEIVQCEPAEVETQLAGGSHEPVDGVITAMDDADAVDRLLASSGPPVVDVGAQMCARGRITARRGAIASIHIDPVAVARAAADHFLEHAFK